MIDRSPYYWDDYSKKSILEAAKLGKIGGFGYDGEGIITLACEYGAAFLDTVLSTLEEHGIEVNSLAHSADKEGFCAVQLYRNHEDIVKVFEKHNISLEYTRLCPMPDSDVYTLFVERRMIKRMEDLAREWHAGQFRKDGITSYIEHPAQVVKMLEDWGFEPDCHGWAIAVAWAHDLIEETPIEKHPLLEDKIESAASGLLNEGTIVLRAVKLLSRDKTIFPNKIDYVKHVADNASFPELAVKIADRLCNTLNFLSTDGCGQKKAREYLALGEPLFEALNKHKKDYDVEKIKKRIESTRQKILEAIENNTQTTPPA